MKNYFRLLMTLLAASMIFMITGCSTEPERVEGDEEGGYYDEEDFGDPESYILSYENYDADIYYNEELKSADEFDTKYGIFLNENEDYTIMNMRGTVYYNLTESGYEKIQLLTSDADGPVGRIILADGSIVRKYNYTSIDSSNPPVAVITNYNEYFGVYTGIGLYTSEEALAYTKKEADCINTNHTPCDITPINSSNSNFSSITVSEISRFSDNDFGCKLWSTIYNRYVSAYADEGAQPFDSIWEVIDAKSNFPAFYWANTYGKTYKDKLGDVTIGWYIPTIAELSTIHKNIEKINKSLEYIKNLDSNYTSGPIQDDFWSSNNTTANYSPTAYCMYDIKAGVIRPNDKSFHHNVLVARIFKDSSAVAEAGEPSLSSIAVTNVPPDFTWQVKDNNLNITGMEVLAYYSNGTAKDVSNSIQTSFFDSSKTGEQYVTLSYSEADKTVYTQIPVNVVEDLTPESLFIWGTPKRDYAVGDVFEIPELRIIYSGNMQSEKEVSSEDVTVEGFDSSNPAMNQEVTLSYIESGVKISVKTTVNIHKYKLGSLVLLDQTVVSADNYTWNEENPPVAIVAGTTKKGKILGVGLNRSENEVQWSRIDVKPTQSSNTFKNTALCKDLQSVTNLNIVGYEYTGEKDGSVIQNALPEGYMNANDCEAFYWAKTYGQTYYSGSAVADGWYLPSLDELLIVYYQCDTIAETFKKLLDIMTPTAFSFINKTDIYWSANTYDDGNAYVINFEHLTASGFHQLVEHSGMEYKLYALAVHTFD